MGLALDEPREGDETHEMGDLAIIVDSFAMKLIREAGGLSIKSGVFGPMAELKGAADAGCSC